ncbi:hypothetical protein Nepgr_018513 [Nepenthes gracilis]|uniref:Uncharacterized protein n=1 Tax=Nepenthes gracilis TaxID=150966 RepID=A0AAD3ST85_NEPGR|nr:hypothetical protein Nepgr_018513 [Nepenthes gracilis]
MLRLEEAVQIVNCNGTVMDEYDKPSEAAERLRIRMVPLSHFYKDGFLLVAFPTRDRQAEEDYRSNS